MRTIFGFNSHSIVLSLHVCHPLTDKDFAHIKHQVPPSRPPKLLVHNQSILSSQQYEQFEAFAPILNHTLQKTGPIRSIWCNSRSWSYPNPLWPQAGEHFCIRRHKASRPRGAWAIKPSPLTMHWGWGRMNSIVPENENMGKSLPIGCDVAYDHPPPLLFFYGRFNGSDQWFMLLHFVFCAVIFSICAIYQHTRSSD